MKLGSFEWRTVALPAAVLAAVVAALLWFSRVQVPRVEQYLHQANLRLLRTMGAQLESRVDGLAGNIDLALKTAVGDARGTVPTLTQERFASFVQMYSAELAVGCLTPESDQQRPRCQPGVDEALWAAADEPPVAQWQRTFGRARLYLGHRTRGYRVVASFDLQKLFTDNLPAEPEFDALLLADASGHVIVQHSAEGLDLSDVSQLPIIGGAAPAGSASDTKDRTRFAPLRHASPDAEVLVGGSVYHFYAQPLSLSLQHLGAKGEPDGVEEWTLCGLVAADRIHAASASVPYDWLVWFGAIVVAVGAAVPLLKLRVLRSHERLTRMDAMLVGASVFIEVALIAFVWLDIVQFRFVIPGLVPGVVPELVRQELHDVSDDLLAELTTEVTAIDQQMASSFDDLRKSTAPAVPTPGGTSRPPSVEVTTGATSQARCNPAWACRAVLKEGSTSDIREMPYPFFDLVNWVDRSGNQQVKFATAASVTPFININEQRLPYAERLFEAVRLGGTMAQNGVSVLVSPTTGRRLTVFWKALPQPDTQPTMFGWLAGQSLATNLLSLDQPVLPADAGFAVVDRTGLVLFHSDRSRSMKENFIQESENSLRLRALVEHGQTGDLQVKYRARDQQLFVRPLTFGEGVAFTSPDWSLIVFQDQRVPDTINLYTLAIAGFLFVGYAIAFAFAWALALIFVRARALAWLWPDRRQARSYLVIAAINASLAVLCVAALYLVPPPTALFLTGLSVVLAIGTSVFVPALSKPPGASVEARGRHDLRNRWLPAFLLARASLLFMLAVVPAMAAMHTAATIEQRTFMVRDLRQREEAARARFSRLQARIQVNGLCSGVEGTPECDERVAAYVRRIADASDGFGIASGLPLFPAQAEGEQASPDSSGGAWSLPLMDRFLRRVHPPLNDLGVALAASAIDVADRHAPRSVPPSFWWLVVLPGVGLIALVLVRDVTDRLCLPALSGARRPVPNAPSAVNRLFLTPPGADMPGDWTKVINARHLDGRLLPLPWPADEPRGDVIVLHHLEAVLTIRDARERLLSQLETAVYQRQAVWLVCDREPVRYLETVLPGERVPGEQRSSGERGEVSRWIVLLQSFRAEFAYVGEAPAIGAVQRSNANGDRAPAPDPLAREAHCCPALAPVIEEVRQRFNGTGTGDADRWRALEDAVEPYYRSIWGSCSIEERLALRQVAEEGLVNPRDRDVLESLMRKGLVVRDPAFRLMNRSFARFVKRAVPPRTIAEWERQVAGTPWSSVRTAVVTFAFAGAGFVAFTQQQIVGAWFGVVLPALAPALLYPAKEAIGKVLARGLTGSGDSA